MVVAIVDGRPRGYFNSFPYCASHGRAAASAVGTVTGLPFPPAFSRRYPTGQDPASISEGVYDRRGLRFRNWNKGVGGAMGFLDLLSISSSLPVFTGMYRY